MAVFVLRLVSWDLSKIFIGIPESRAAPAPPGLDLPRILTSLLAVGAGAGHGGGGGASRWAQNRPLAGIRI